MFTLHLLPVKGYPEGCCDPDQHRLSLAVVQEAAQYNNLQFPQRTLVSLLVRHLMSTGLQFITVVMQLNKYICNCNSKRQGNTVLWLSDRSLRSQVISHHPKGKTESWLKVGTVPVSIFSLLTHLSFLVVVALGCLPQKVTVTSLCCGRQEIH